MAVDCPGGRCLGVGGNGAMKKPTAASKKYFGDAVITPTRGDNSYGYDAEKVELRRKIEERQEAMRLMKEWGVGYD